MKKLILAALLFLTPAVTKAATLISGSSGAFTAAGTWFLANPTAAHDSEAASTAIGVTYTTSAVFVPGAIEINAIAVKLASRVAAPVGTFRVELWNLTDNVAQANTETIVDVADFHNVQVAGGWYVFPTAGAVTLTAAKGYVVRVRCSTTGEVTLFRNGTAANWARQLRTTTNQAPAANDQLIIAGELTGQGTNNPITVTMDNTASVSFGTALSTRSVCVSKHGTLYFSTAPNVNINLEVKGYTAVFGGGTLNIGTADNFIHASSTATLLLDSAANVDSSLFIANGSTFTVYGSTVDYTWTRLAANVVRNDTTATTVDDTGWVANSTVVFVTTNRAAVAVLQSECEEKRLTGVSGTTLNVVALSTAHTGPSGSVPGGEIGLITHNVIIRGNSPALQGAININPTAMVDVNNAEIKWLGSNTALFRGIDIQTTTGFSTFTHCSISSFTVTGSLATSITGAASNNIYIASNVFNSNVNMVSVAATTGNNITFSKNLFSNSAAAQLFILADNGVHVKENAFAGGTIAPYFNGGTDAFTGTVVGNLSHSMSGNAMTFGNNVRGATAKDSFFYKINGPAIDTVGNNSNIIIDSATVLGCLTASLSIDGVADTTFKYLTSGSIPGFATVSAVNYTAVNSNVRFENSNFGVGTATHTQSFLFNSTGAGWGTFYFDNTMFGDTTEVGSQSAALDGTFVGSQNHDQINGNHKTWSNGGTLTIDETIYDVLPSARMTPLSATVKMRGPKFWVAVGSNTTTTATVKVRESVAGDGTDYNGNLATLILLKNIPAGITADVICATATVASAGAFETISCTSPTVGDDAILGFEVRVDGTTGWVNVDTWTNTNPIDTKAVKNWSDGIPESYGDNATSGGGGTSSFMFVQ